MPTRAMARTGYEIREPPQTFRRRPTGAFLYRDRNAIERIFGWLADFRRISAFVIYWYEAWYQPHAAGIPGGAACLGEVHYSRNTLRRRASDYFSIHGNFDAITRTLEQRTW